MTSQWNTNFSRWPPSDPPGRDSSRGKRRVGLIVGISLLLVAALMIAGVVVYIGFNHETAPDDRAGSSSEKASQEGGTGSGADYPGKGTYRLKQVDTGLCMTWGHEPGNEGREVTVFGDCAKAKPKLTWTPDSRREFVVTMDFTRPEWKACLAADKPATKPGYLFSGRDCAKGDPLQTFVLSAKGADEYILKVKTTKMCVGPLESKAKRGMVFSTVKCSGTDKSLRFTLE